MASIFLAPDLCGIMLRVYVPYLINICSNSKGGALSLLSLFHRGEKRGEQMLSNLPKIILLVNGRSRIPIQTVESFCVTQWYTKEQAGGDCFVGFGQQGDALSAENNRTC